VPSPQTTIGPSPSASSASPLVAVASIVATTLNDARPSADRHADRRALASPGTADCGRQTALENSSVQYRTQIGLAPF
jgi:hypothetical protein